MAPRLQATEGGKSDPMTGRICYLHVGTGKTGSSAIQYALTRAHDRLRDQGYLYPDAAGNFGKVLAGMPTAGNALTINNFLRDRNLESAVRIVERYRDQPHHLIWSCEGLVNRRPDLLREFGAALRSLGYTTRCLVFFRPQVDMIVSSYLQQVKSGKVNVGLETYVSRKFGLRPAKRWDWQWQARKLHAAFGNLKVVWYPTVRRKGPAGVIDVAFEWLGLDQPADLPPRIINPTPGREALHVLRTHGNGRKHFADAFLAEAERRDLLGSPVTLPPEAAAHIHEATFEGNAELLRRYCPELSVRDEIRAPAMEEEPPLDADVMRELTAIAQSILRAPDRNRARLSAIRNNHADDASVTRPRSRMSELLSRGLSRFSSRGVRP